ncbi:M-phase inducer phosphatase [Plakobranchus ocellatus]|uniref:M-phase inducer phosphatase n=1 Tax=Plakobranchus ocellatus TaxID=259542 RepID=A0AAV4A969_9GAST|nr:M-phase inducer phosphatase [Plakobranchus ocellatus]
MDVSMESNELSLSPDTAAHDRLSALDRHKNDDHLMPPPVAPPSALPSHLAQDVMHSSSFLSPSKEGEVSMECSPRIKKHIEKKFSKNIVHTSVTSAAETFPSKEQSHEYESTVLAGSPDMLPSEVFTKSPGSPSSEFKAMLDAIDVQESPGESSDDNFLKRQEKPNLRRCRSLEMRKRLFDMSNTPPNAFKQVFKRPASVETGAPKQTRLTKRPKELKLGRIKEATTSPLVKEAEEAKSPLEGPSKPGESSDHERIKVAVDVLQSPDVIGDCSREHCLPVITGKHSDLKNISHETMAHLLNHGFDDKFDKLTVIDCRYPYEYKGGHIKGAINLYTEEDIDKFLKKEVLKITGEKPKTHILIFHCEFSSQRGPGLLRQLRKLDRQMNIHQYPQLTFPEMYVLHLGYKEFFTNHPHLCVPSAYIPMADESYINDLKHFRAKAKTWTAGERNGLSK